MKTTFPEDAPWHLSKSVLNAGALNGALSLLGPGAEVVATTSLAERILYVAHGTVTASVGPANYILNCDETLHVLPQRALAWRNQGSTPAKVLVVTLPAKSQPDPAVLTFTS